MIPNDQKVSPEIRSAKKWKSFVILIIGIVLSIAATIYSLKYLKSIAKQEFTLVCNEVKAKINIRLFTQAQLLRSGAAFFAASKSVTRNDWKVFIESNKLNKNLPGITDIGFSVIIKKEQLQQHIQLSTKRRVENVSIMTWPAKAIKLFQAKKNKSVYRFLNRLTRYLKMTMRILSI